MHLTDKNKNLFACERWKDNARITFGKFEYTKWLIILTIENLNTIIWIREAILHNFHPQMFLNLTILHAVKNKLHKRGWFVFFLSQR